MITSTIGKIFLKAYNEKYSTSYNAKAFFVKQYYPLFFNSSKYMQWVQNSPFVQMKKGQKVESLTDKERLEKLSELHDKIDKGLMDASIAIGYSASEEKGYATTSGQVSNIEYYISKDDVYLSWIGSSLGIGLQGGLSILFSNPIVLLDIYEGWKLYRKMLDDMPDLKGNQINTWNGQWVAHRYDKNSFVEKMPMANFSPLSLKGDGLSIAVQSWTKVLIAVSKTFSNPQMMGYVYNFGQTNTTIGFIPFVLTQIRRPVELYEKLFGIDSEKKAEPFWGTAFGFAKACQMGSIGIRAMEPKGLRDCIEHGKLPKFSNNEEQKININTYKIWIMAMLNNEDLWAKAQELATELQKYAIDGQKGKTVNSRKVDSIVGATKKLYFIKALAEVVIDVEDKEKIEEIGKLVNAMPTENVPYFLTLVRFNYAAINNNKTK